jgi:hypothetical protein
MNESNESVWRVIIDEEREEEDDMRDVKKEVIDEVAMCARANHRTDRWTDDNREQDRDANNFIMFATR